MTDMIKEAHDCEIWLEQKLKKLDPAHPALKWIYPSTLTAIRAYEKALSETNVQKTLKSYHKWSSHVESHRGKLGGTVIDTSGLIPEAKKEVEAILADRFAEVIDKWRSEGYSTIPRCCKFCPEYDPYPSRRGHWRQESE
jgi:hypothetical protein